MWQSISFVKISFFIKVEMMLRFRKLENFLSLFVSAYLYVILLRHLLEGSCEIAVRMRTSVRYVARTSRLHL